MDKPSTSFNKLGLLEQSQVIERAKVLGDKKKLLKDQLKDKIQSQTSQNQVIQSTFAKQLENGQYLCICCKVRLNDNIQAIKHFSQLQEHKDNVEQFKQKVQSKVEETKLQLVKDQQEKQQSEIAEISESKNDKKGFMLVQEEEIVEEQELLQDDESKQNQANLELELQKFNAEIMKDDETAITMSKYEGQYKDREEDDDNGGKYQSRLISEIDEIEQLQLKIQQKKTEILTKKRKNKIDLNELLKDNDQHDFNLKRRKQ